ncbi:MAG: AsmA family protein [Pseudomonadota bacterium]
MRWILRLVLLVVIVVAVALGALFLLPTDRIARLATDRIEAATGRTVTIEGPIRPTLWPALGISTGPVTVANAPWSEEGPMFAAKALTLSVDAAALIGGDIRITQIVAEAPQLVLERNEDGAANWELSGAAPAPSPATEETAQAESGSGGTAFALDEARLNNGTVLFHDRMSGQRVVASAINAVMALPAFAGTGTAEISAVVKSVPITATLSIAGVQAFLSQGAVPVVLNAEIDGVTVGFDGRAGLVPLAVGGRLIADIPNWAPVFALLDSPAPDIPQGLGRSVDFSGDVTWSEAGKLTLREGTIRLDQNTLVAAADLTLTGERPMLTADVSTGALDLSALAPPPSADGTADGGESADARPTGWSDTPIDVSFLQALDAEIAVAAESVDLGTSQLGRTRLLTKLENGRAVTEIQELFAYDGAVTGSVVVNSRGGLSTRATLAGAGLALKPLLTQFADYERLEAVGDVQLNVLGVGNSLNALMNSWEGDAAVSLGQGALQGFDLVGMLRNLDTSFVGEGHSTIFDSISATFAITGGQVTNPDLAFLAPFLNATGDGRIGLGSQDVDYRLLPVLLEGADGGGVQVPLEITGPWHDLSFSLDVEALIRQEFDDEIEAVKDRVEEEVKDRVSEELGIEVDTLDNLEDTLKENAGEGILNLLGR